MTKNLLFIVILLANVFNIWNLRRQFIGLRNQIRTNKLCKLLWKMAGQECVSFPVNEDLSIILCENHLPTIYPAHEVQPTGQGLCWRCVLELNSYMKRINRPMPAVDLLVPISLLSQYEDWMGNAATI